MAPSPLPQFFNRVHTAIGGLFASEKRKTTEQREILCLHWIFARGRTYPHMISHQALGGVLLGTHSGSYLVYSGTRLYIDLTCHSGIHWHLNGDKHFKRLVSLVASRFLKIKKQIVHHPLHLHGNIVAEIGSCLSFLSTNDEFIFISDNGTQYKWLNGVTQQNNPPQKILKS